jgi:hypothetical protein
VRRPTLGALVVVVGVLLLVDLLVVNASLGELAGLFVDAAILVAAGAALAGVAALAVRRGGDLWRRRGDPVGAALVLLGIGSVLVAGLRPGAEGAADPAVDWLVAALMVPIGATLFGILFISTLAATRRSLATRGRDATVLAAAALVTLVLLLPLAGPLGTWLSSAAGWALAVPIGAVFRGLLLGVAILAALVAARTMLRIGSADE